MTAGVYNMQIEQGADFVISVFYKEEDGTPVDLTGFTGRGKIREKATDSAAIIDLTVAIVDAAGGEVLVSLTAVQTATITTTGDGYLEKELYYYDVELVNGSSVTRLLNGKCFVSPEITK